MTRSWFVVALLAASVAGCSPGEIVDDDAGTGTRGFGEGCERSEDCASTLCVAVSADRSVCTELCDEDAQCPEGGWGCVQPEGFDATLCGCEATRGNELCGDGLDNECNGRPDDCRVCGGIPVPENDPRNCGECGVICGFGQECHEGACRCASASAMMCGSLCVDVQTDESHCGECDRRCLAAQTCVAGACTCPSSVPDACSTVCTNMDTDPTNCGRCGNVCGAAQRCESGDCRCPTGLAVCDDRCADVRSSPTDCGECGHACRSDQTCTSYECRCTSGTECGGSCIDTNSDAANCGACGRACATGEYCSGGACQCDSGLVCGGACMPWNDPENCGACGVTCQAGASCSGNRCVCFAGSWPSECDGTCVDLFEDSDHCGACDRACDPAQICSGGTCQCATTGDTLCSGACVTLRTDPLNCGSCGNACGLGQTCSSSACRCPTTATTLCSTGCADLRADPNNCGSCGNVCRSGESCSSFACRCPLTSQRWCAAEGTCIDVLSDEANCGTCGRVCPSTATCNSGTCGCNTAGQTVCGDGCYDTTTDEAHCGSCTNACTGSQQCLASACRCEAPMIGTPLRITTAINHSQNVAIASNGTRAAVVYADLRGTRSQIFMQLVAADGTAIGLEQQLSAVTAGAAIFPDVVWNGSEWAVVWGESSPATIRLARYDVDGLLLGSQTTPSQDAAGTVSAVQALTLQATTALGYVVVYQTGTFGRPTSLRALGATGATVGLPIDVSSAGDNTSFVSAAAPTGEIGVLLVNGSGSTVALQVVNADGSVTASRVALGTGNQPSILHDGTTWVGAWMNGGSLIAGRGAALGSRVTVATGVGTTPLTRRPELARVDGEVVVTFQARATTSDTTYRIDARRYAIPTSATAALTSLEPSAATIVSTATAFDLPLATAAATGGMLLGWSDTRWGTTEVYDASVLLPACAM